MGKYFQVLVIRFATSQYLLICTQRIISMAKIFLIFSYRWRKTTNSSYITIAARKIHFIRVRLFELRFYDTQLKVLLSLSAIQKLIKLLLQSRCFSEKFFADAGGWVKAIGETLKKTHKNDVKDVSVKFKATFERSWGKIMSKVMCSEEKKLGH